MQLQFRWKLHSIRKMQKPLQIYPKRTKFTLCQYSLHISFWLWFSKEIVSLKFLWKCNVINQPQTSQIVNSNVVKITITGWWNVSEHMVFNNLRNFSPFIYLHHLRNSADTESLHYFTVDWCLVWKIMGSFCWTLIWKMINAPWLTKSINYYFNDKKLWKTTIREIVNKVSCEPLNR